MPRTEAQKRADKKYHAKTYKTFTVNAKIADYDTIDSFCKNKDISKASFIIAACMDFIKRDCLPDGVNTVKQSQTAEQETAQEATQPEQARTEP